MFGADLRHRPTKLTPAQHETRRLVHPRSPLFVGDFVGRTLPAAKSRVGSKGEGGGPLRRCQNSTDSHNDRLWNVRAGRGAAPDASERDVRLVPKALRLSLIGGRL